MPKLVVSLCCMMVVVASCSSTSEPSASFFDSLVTRQVHALITSKAGLTKIARIGDASDEKSFTPDLKSWENELNIFRQLDAFEKPAYRTEYDVRDNVKDPSSNLLIRVYHARTKVPVPELRFYYFRSFQNLRKIEAEYESDNSLFRGRRKLSLEFEELNGQPHLVAYVLEGIQKIVLTDSTRFAIRGNIRY